MWWFGESTSGVFRPVGSEHDECPVGFESVVPAGVVFEMVMVRTEGQQIRQDGRSAVDPVVEVMHLAAVERDVTSGMSTGRVHRPQHASLLCGGGAFGCGDPIDRAVRYVLGREGLFLNTSSDARLLPTLLESAARIELGDIPGDAEMDADVVSFDMAPLFDEVNRNEI